MKELVKSLVEDYKLDRVTWHEIQDIIEGECLARSIVDADTILQEIEQEIKRSYTAIAELHAHYYKYYILAQERYEAKKRFSDLMSYLEYGRACGVLSTDDIRRLADRTDSELDRELLYRYFKL